jgi:tetratricopeptide (TPR) repeat protein
MIFISKRPQNFRLTWLRIVALAALSLLAGCVSESNHPNHQVTAGNAAVNLDAKLIQAAGLKRSLIVLVVESGGSRDDDSARARFESSTAKKTNLGILPVLLDISLSRNRATATQFHITNTPVLLCLSPRGFIVSRDDGPVSAALLERRGRELVQRASELDAKFAFLESPVKQNQADAPAQFALANFLLAQQNTRQAIPHFEAVAFNETADTDLRIQAWVKLAKAHLWISEPEKGRHQSENLISTLGQKTGTAIAGGYLVLGIQDANAKRLTLAREEFEKAIAAAPASAYGKQAAEELAKLPGDKK